ncbi:MAG: winged helix-turn-helix domain-containing protein [Ideonella sp.]|nr:winged helix-turn-helix domain-containing protein [Ideonella sp.]
MTSLPATVDASAAALPHALRFGRCVLHPQSRELWRDGEPVEIQRLALDVLLYLMAHPGRDVSKEELLREVWGDVAVTDSVVARAVMKLRRAIGDEAQPPALLRTVHGVGYRWLTAAHTHTSPALPPPTLAEARQVTVVVLPVEVPTETPLAWAQEGLPALLSHLLGAEGGIRLVEAAQVQQADLPLASWPERAANVRAALGATWVVKAQLTHQAGALHLGLHANPDRADGQEQAFEAACVPALAEQAAAWLAQQWAAPPRSTQTLEAATLELLARGSHETRQGRLAAARGLLLQAQGLSPDSPLVCNELANVLRLTGELEAAKAAAEKAWALIQAMPAPDRPTALAFKVRMSQAMLAHALGQLQQSRHYLDLAEPLAKSLPGRHERAEWMLFSGFLAQCAGDGAQAVSELESAISLLVGSDDVLLQVRARIRLADVLGERGLVTRASELLHRAQQLLSRIQAEPTQATVQLFSAILHKRRRHFTMALAQLEQVRAVYEQVGHAYTVWYCRAMRIEPLMELGQLSRAEQEARALMADAQAWRPQAPLPLPDVDLLMPLRLAQLQWLRGEHALSLAESLLALKAALGSEYLRGVLVTHQLRVLSQCLSLDRPALADEVLSQIRWADDPLMQARQQAIQSMASGEVALTMQVLREAWNSGPSHAAARMDAAIDLAWLALVHEQPQELESLMAHIDDECDEYLPAIVVRARYLDRQGLRQEALSELLRVMQVHGESNLALVRAAVQALRQGQAWPLVRSLLTEAVRD